jgi:hypothetical protein
MRTGPILVGAAICAAGYFLVGCIGELIEIKPASVEDLGVSGPDLTEVELGPPRFFPDIQKDLDKLTCTTTGGCHGGSQMPFFKPNPQSQADKDANYDAFVSKCNPMTPTASLVIQKSTNAMPHSGGQLLKATDPEYKRWIEWIGSGMQK